MDIKRQSGKFQFEEDLFSKNAEGISKIYHEFSMIMKFLQTKPQVKKMNSKYYDLYYTVNKKRDEKIIEDEKCEKIKMILLVIMILLLLIIILGEKNDSELLKRRKFRSQINRFK